MDNNKSQKKLKENLLKTIVDMAFFAGSNSAHLGGALSSVDIASVLFDQFFKFGKNLKDDYRDRFILSKGHACLLLYAILHEKGFLKYEQIKTFEQPGSLLMGHPVKNIELGIEFSTGSLGMGLSIAAGIGISLLKKKINNKIYVLLGDGECNEGSIWEAAMFCGSKKLNNIITIIDKNNFQQTGSTKEILKNDNIAKQWELFGWNVVEINGHSIFEISDAFLKTQNQEKPFLILANTIKGKGISFIENNNNWHHSILTEKYYNQAILEIEKINK